MVPSATFPGEEKHWVIDDRRQKGKLAEHCGRFSVRL
jgi:hypothetical protein